MNVGGKKSLTLPSPSGRDFTNCQGSRFKPRNAHPACGRFGTGIPRVTPTASSKLAARSGRDSTHKRSRCVPPNLGGAPVSNRLRACGRTMPVTNRRSGSGRKRIVPRDCTNPGVLTIRRAGNRGFLSAGERIYGPQKAAICAPERRASVRPVCNRQFPRDPDCQFQTGGTFIERAGVRGNDGQSIRPMFKQHG